MTLYDLVSCSAIGEGCLFALSKGQSYPVATWEVADYSLLDKEEALL
jgi:hypothetical protein